MAAKPIIFDRTTEHFYAEMARKAGVEGSPRNEVRYATSRPGGKGYVKVEYR